MKGKTEEAIKELQPRWKGWDGVYVSDEKGFNPIRGGHQMAGMDVNGQTFTETETETEYMLVASNRKVWREVKRDAIVFRNHATIEVFGRERDIFRGSCLARVCEVFELRNFIGKVIGIRLKAS